MKALYAMIVVMCFTLGTMPAFATGNHSDKPKPKPPSGGTPTQQSAPPQPAPTSYAEDDQHKTYFWGGAAMGGLAITALQKSEHPWLYATGGCALAALAIEKARSGAFDSKNARYGVGGCAAGATGIGLTFGKDFFKWEHAIKF